MAYRATSDHYRTSSLSHPANSPFGKTQQVQQQQPLQQTQQSPQQSPQQFHRTGSFLEESKQQQIAQAAYASPAAAAAGFGASQSFNASASFAPSVTQSSPFTVRPELDPLEREKREIERRRQRLDDRKTRILHAKTRVMGVDVEALSDQVKERAERERLEQERELYHDALTAHHAKTLSGLEEERKVRERVSKEELNFYRQQQSSEKRQREARDASGWSGTRYRTRA